MARISGMGFIREFGDSQIAADWLLWMLAWFIFWKDTGSVPLLLRRAGDVYFVHV